jgi:hypothetical protein
LIYMTRRRSLGRVLSPSVITFTEASCRNGKFYDSLRVSFCVTAAKILERTAKALAPPMQKVRKEDSLTERRHQSGSLRGRQYVLLFVD